MACIIKHIIHPGMSFDSWRGATWRTARHAMSHARKTGKAFKRLLPKEAPIHLGRPANRKHQSLKHGPLNFKPSLFSSSMSQYTTIRQYTTGSWNQQTKTISSTQSPSDQNRCNSQLWVAFWANRLEKTRGAPKGNGFRYKTRFDIQGIGMNL